MVTLLKDPDEDRNLALRQRLASAMEQLQVEALRIDEEREESICDGTALS